MLIEENNLDGALVRVVKDKIIFIMPDNYDESLIDSMIRSHDPARKTKRETRLERIAQLRSKLEDDTITTDEIKEILRLRLFTEPSAV